MIKNKATTVVLFSIVLLMSNFAGCATNVPSGQSTSPQTPQASPATANSSGSQQQLIVQVRQPGQFESLSATPSNSWWFETPDGGLVMFDAQRTLTDARALVETIRSTGKPLRALFMTHPHPDHITGFGTVKAAFPDAAIYSTSEANSYLDEKANASRHECEVFRR